MIDKLNELRAVYGLPALRENVQLSQAAYAHAIDLSRHSEMTIGNPHMGSDGSDIDDRLRRAGYDPDYWGEVTGWGWGGDSDRMINWWMDSPSHRSVILTTQMDEVGAAYLPAPGSAWGFYWVVDFGRRGEVEQPPQPARPYTVNVPIVMNGGGGVTVDLLPYLRGDGRSYRVGNTRGSFEIFQSQTSGDRFYQVKAWDDLSMVHWEGFRTDDEYIRRDVDTSPGGGRFYRQFDAPWVRRRMKVGDTFTQGKRVQFYRLENCVPLEQYSGDVIDTIKLVAHHKQYTFPACDWPPVTLDDVIELEWVQGGEAYWYARGFGLVGWARRHADTNSPQWSAISELRPDVGRLQRLSIGCLG